MNASTVLQRTMSLAPGGVRAALRVGIKTSEAAIGVAQNALGLRPEPRLGMDDATLARKVETVVFGERGVPKSAININVVDGVVYLRGEVKHAEQIRAIKAKVLEVPEVRGHKPFA